MAEESDITRVSVFYIGRGMLTVEVPIPEDRDGETFSDGVAHGIAAYLEAIEKEETMRAKPAPTKKILDPLNTVSGLVEYFNTTLSEGERLAVPSRMLHEVVEGIDPKTELDIRYVSGVYYIRRA